ncbi:MAG: aminopeptidase N, partial [Pseudomonadota bacterium]|nr:aminopeptidase N [Pseudomonadota bacterium]
MRTETPRTIRLQDYRAPDYRIAEIALDFSLDPQATRVKATSKIERRGAADAPLTLNGEDLKLISLALDGHPLAPDAYAVDDESLTIHNPPDQFTLEIVTEIAPAKNTALEGLYMAGGIFCTQCEAEGFRRITYF